MNQSKIGQFIARCRKEKKLTQAQLAEKLGITDRAVSKWETGKKENHFTKNVIIAILFSMALLTGIVVCLICNIAISGALTWSLIPIGSMVYAWAVSFPAIVLGKKGITASLVSLSFFTIPYLFVLSRLTRVQGVFSIGTAVSFVSILFLWIVAAICRRIGKSGKLNALGIIFLSAIPLMFVINAMLTKMISEPLFDVWDALTVFVLLILSFSCFMCDYARKKGLLK